MSRLVIRRFQWNSYNISIYDDHVSNASTNAAIHYLDDAVICGLESIQCILNDYKLKDKFYDIIGIRH